MGYNAIQIQFIEHSLKVLAECVKTGNYSIDPRDKNRYFLSLNGYTYKDQEAILLSLKLDNFIKYDEDQNDPESEWYWIFKTKYDRRVIYVKFKLLLINGNYAYVKSLHLDDFTESPG